VIVVRFLFRAMPHSCPGKSLRATEGKRWSGQSDTQPGRGGPFFLPALSLRNCGYHVNIRFAKRIAQNAGCGVQGKSGCLCEQFGFSTVQVAFSSFFALFSFFLFLFSCSLDWSAAREFPTCLAPRGRMVCGRVPVQELVTVVD